MNDRKETGNKAAAVICEMNLPHRGHARLARKLKEITCDSVLIAVMSGDFVQRGDAAAVGKAVRAEAALSVGFDLVLELPYPWSCAPAENFSAAGAAVAAGAGAGILAFGSECGEIGLLSEAAGRMGSKEYHEALCAERETHGSESEIRLRVRVFSELYGEEAFFPKKPNDILAAEYIRAVEKYRFSLNVLTVKREGEESATAARALYRAAFDCRGFDADGEKQAQMLLTDRVRETVRAFAEEGREPKSIFSERSDGLFCGFYGFSDRKTLEKFAGMKGGIAGRLCAAAGKNTTVAGLLSDAATKKYTDARLRRALIHGVIGTEDADLRALPRFTNVLAATERGRSYLRELERERKRKGETEEGFVLFARPAAAKREKSFARQYELMQRAERLYGMI